MDINKAIGKHLTETLKNSEVTEYYICKKLKICDNLLLKRIKDGTNKKTTPLKVIIEIYQALGFNEIEFKENDIYFKLKW